MGWMSSVADRFGAVILVTVLVGLPLGALATILLARRRIEKGWAKTWAWRASAAELGMLVGTAPWVWMILTPSGRPGGVQIFPFRDLLGVLASQDTIVQVVGNLLVFAAFGFCLPIRFRLAPACGVVFVVARSLRRCRPCSRCSSSPSSWGGSLRSTTCW